MQVNGHAASVINNAQRPVAMQSDINLATEAGQRLVHRVINNLLRQVIGAGGIGIHSRSLANRLQTREDLNRVGVVLRHKSVHFIYQLRLSNLVPLEASAFTAWDVAFVNHA